MGAEPRLTAASAPTALRTSPRSSARGWPRRACPRPPRLWALLPMSSRAIVHWGQTALQVGTQNCSFWLNLSFLVFETVGAIDTKLIPEEQWQLTRQRRPSQARKEQQVAPWSYPLRRVQAVQACHPYRRRQPAAGMRHPATKVGCTALCWLCSSQPCYFRECDFPKTKGRGFFKN